MMQCLKCQSVFEGNGILCPSCFIIEVREKLLIPQENRQNQHPFGSSGNAGAANPFQQSQNVQANPFQQQPFFSPQPAAAYPPPVSNPFAAGNSSPFSSAPPVQAAPPAPAVSPVPVPPPAPPVPPAQAPSGSVPPVANPFEQMKSKDTFSPEDGLFGKKSTNNIQLPDFND